MTAGGRRLMMTDPGETSRGSTYGAWVAEESFVAGLLRFGTWDHYEFLTSRAARSAAEQRVRTWGRPGVAAVDVGELGRRGDALGLSAWHGGFPGVTVPFHVRERHATRPFPITLLEHSVSYQEFLHRFLLVLLVQMRPCDTVVCTSRAARRSAEILLETVASRMNERHGTQLNSSVRMDTLPLGVDTEALAPCDQGMARRKLQLPEEPIVLLWLGRVSAADKADLTPLLTAFHDIRQYAQALGGDDQRSLLLVIAGADPHGHVATLADYANTLGIAEQVQFFTEVDADNKVAFYNAADVFVAPVDNIQETFGITPVEAMACGVPQVVADWNGYRDTVVHEVTGMLVPTTWIRSDEDLIDDPLTWIDRYDHAALARSVVVDPTALRSALIDLVLNEDLRRRMSAASRQRAEQEFSWRAVIPRYEELWDDLGAVARDLDRLPRVPTSHVEPFFFDAFAHYATKVIDDGQRLCATPAGVQALDNPRELADADGDARVRLMRRALDRLGNREMSIAEILSGLVTDGDETLVIDECRRNVMNLVKYGYARFT